MAKPAPVAAEVCEKEFERMCAARRIDTDVSEMTRGEKRLFEARKTAVLRYMKSGTLVVNPEGNPVYTPPVDGGQPITFHKATGATMMAGDGYGEGFDAGRLVAVATELTKSVPGALSKLDIEDFRAVSDITNFLMLRS